MNLIEAVTSKRPFRRKATINRSAGRWIEQANVFGIDMFKFQKPALPNQKEPVVFEVSDFESEWEIEEEKMAPLKKAIAVALELVEALKQAAKEISPDSPSEKS